MIYLIYPKYVPHTENRNAVGIANPPHPLSKQFDVSRETSCTEINALVESEAKWENCRFEPCPVPISTSKEIITQQ